MENIATHQDEFFILLERVGTKGRYQRYFFLLSFGLWFITAFLILSVAFLLLPNKFVCPQFPDEQKCKQFVCSLPQEQWHEYESRPIFNSIITELGDYHCQHESKISLFKMVLFVGIFAGYFVFMHFSDNMGRRFGMLLTWSTVVVGLLLITFSHDMISVSVGLLLAGAGCESNMRIDLSVLNQMVDYHLRQRYSLILQCSFGVGGVMIACGYYYFRDWRTVNTVFCTIPAILLLVLMILYLEETPNYLSRKGTKAVLASLRRIAAINGFQCQVTENDVVKVMQLKRQRAQAQTKTTFSMLDLMKFKSLKKKTFNLAGIFFFLSSLYIGTNSAVDQFQVNIFLLQAILSLSDFVAYPIACFFIHDTRRKRAGIKCFILCALFNLVAFTIVNNQDCPTCFSHIAKLILMFGSRYCVSYYYGILFIYVIEIYPEQIRTIGFGTVSAVGALGAIFIQQIIQIFVSYHQDPLPYFAVFSLICAYLCSQLPETHGTPLQVEIEQLKVPKQKQTYQPSQPCQTSVEMSFDSLGLHSQEHIDNNP